MKNTQIPFQTLNLLTKLRFIWPLGLLVVFACFFACSFQTPILDQESKKETHRGTDVKVFRLQNREQYDKLPNISEQELLSIANKALSQNFGDANPKNIVLCENVLFWKVLYEAQGIEFGISKDTHDVLMVRKLPIPKERDSLAGSFTEGRALAIANDETRSYLDSFGAADELGDFHTIACELKNSWRIYYVDNDTWNSIDWSHLPNSNPPNYLIDKQDGKVLYRSYDTTTFPR